MIVTLSFALSIVLLNSVYTYVTSFDFDKFVADFSLTDFTVSDTTVINNYAPYNTANVSQDFISQAESLNGLEDIGNIYLLLWSSIFVTLMANKIGGLQFGIYRNCQISSRVFHTAVAALPLTKANRSDFE